jgi:hypothetical protein
MSHISIVSRASSSSAIDNQSDAETRGHAEGARGRGGGLGKRQELRIRCDLGEVVKDRGVGR